MSDSTGRERLLRGALLGNACFSGFSAAVLLVGFGPLSRLFGISVADLVVFVEFVTMDGPGGTLGSAGPCWVRGGSMLPIFGSVRMDADDGEGLQLTATDMDLGLFLPSKVRPSGPRRGLPRRTTTRAVADPTPCEVRDLLLVPR